MEDRKEIMNKINKKPDHIWSTVEDVPKEWLENTGFQKHGSVFIPDREEENKGQIYTSYYYQLQSDRDKQFPSDLLLIVASNSIDRWVPKDTRKRLITKYQDLLKPRMTNVTALKEGEISWKEFEYRYINYLEGAYKRNLSSFKELFILAVNKGIVLFCYENVYKKETNCHRTILRQWLSLKASKIKITLDHGEWRPITPEEMKEDEEVDQVSELVKQANRLTGIKFLTLVSHGDCPAYREYVERLTAIDRQIIEIVNKNKPVKENNNEADP